MIVEKTIENLNEIKYGWIDKDGNIHKISTKDFFMNNYHLMSIDEIKGYGVGTSFEEAEYARFLLQEVAGVSARNDTIRRRLQPNQDISPTRTARSYQPNSACCCFYTLEHFSAEELQSQDTKIANIAKMILGLRKNLEEKINNNSVKFEEVSGENHISNPSPLTSNH